MRSRARHSNYHAVSNQISIPGRGRNAPIFCSVRAMGAYIEPAGLGIEFGNPSVTGGGGSMVICVSGLRDTGAPLGRPSVSSICIGSPWEAASGRRWPPSRLEPGLMGGSEVEDCEFACCQPASYPISRSWILAGGGSGGGAVFMIPLEAIGNGPCDENDSSGIA